MITTKEQEKELIKEVKFIKKYKKDLLRAELKYKNMEVKLINDYIKKIKKQLMGLK